MKEFLERLGILLHLLGYISSIVNLIVAIVLEEYFFILISPSSLLLGWGLRWLFTGRLVNIIPFFDSHKSAILSIPKIIMSVKNPLEYWLPVLGYFIVIFFLTLGDLHFETRNWERNVFGQYCTDSEGNPRSLGKFEGTDKSYYCSDYPKLCTWGENDKTPNCILYQKYKKPDVGTGLIGYFKEPIFYPIVLLPMIIFHFIIRMIIFIRKS